MVTFNNFTLRRNADGQLFLDLELNVVFAPQKTIMRMSFPASLGYVPDPEQPITNGEHSPFDNDDSDCHSL